MCGNEYQYGPHRYDGHYISKYKISVCSICYAGNWDGWNSHYEEKLIVHLHKNKLPIPERNAKGWFPRD